MDARLGGDELLNFVFDFWAGGRRFYFVGALWGRLGETFRDLGKDAEADLEALQAVVLRSNVLRAQLQKLSMAFGGAPARCIYFPLEKVEAGAERGSVGGMWGACGMNRQNKWKLFLVGGRFL